MGPRRALLVAAACAACKNVDGVVLTAEQQPPEAPFTAKSCNDLKTRELCRNELPAAKHDLNCNWLTGECVEVPSFQKNFTGKLLLVTSTFPVDVMPIDLIVRHQIEALGGSFDNSGKVTNVLNSWGKGATLETVVYNNHPPWLPDEDGPHGAAMQRLRGAGINIEPFDYNIIDDDTWLDKFYNTENMINVSETRQRFDNKSLRAVFGMEGEQKQKMSNFVAMQSFLNRCLDDEGAELCLYLDPDMLLYRNYTNNFQLVDLAASTFNEHPEAWVMSPPFACFDNEWWGLTGRHGRKEGACSAKPTFVSSRHMIVNRTRMLQALPLVISPGNRIDIQYHEVTLTEVLRAAGTPAYQMLCGMEFFAVHPPSRFQKLHEVINLKQTLGHLAVDVEKRRALEQVKKSPGSRSAIIADAAEKIATDRTEVIYGANAASDVILRGTQELIRRFEAGHSMRNKSAILNDACGCCSDMLPNYERMTNGLAFGKKKSSQSYSANKASFDWVLQCGAGEKDA